MFDGRATSAILECLPEELLTLALPLVLVGDEQVSALPRTLKYVDIGTSLLTSQGLQRLPPYIKALILRQELSLAFDDFKSLPPDLLTFEMHTDRNRTFDASALMVLPTQLVSLTLDVTLTLPLRHLQFLPSALEVLRLPQTTIIEDSQHVLFSLPPTLTDLALLYIQGEALVREAMSRLPPLLRSFHLTDAANIGPQHIHMIPRSITHLTLRKAAGINTSCLNLLPPKLTRFTISRGYFRADALLKLPQTLTHLDTGNMAIATENIDQAFRQGRIPRDLLVWRTKRTEDFNVPHLYSFVDVREKPSILRLVGYQIAKMDGPKMTRIAFHLLGTYVAWKNGQRFLPATPGVVSGLLLRFKNSILLTGLSILWALR